MKIRLELTVENPFTTAMVMADIRGTRFDGPSFWERKFLRMQTIHIVILLELGSMEIVFDSKRRLILQCTGEPLFDVLHCR